MFRNFRYQIAENFPTGRLCLCIMVTAFAAVVSVYKYIDLAGMAAISFSSMEAAWLILNDSVNQIYIFLPLYIFLVCGILFDNHFGAAEILKCGGRRDWMLSKFAVLLFETMLFFGILLLIVVTACSYVFPASAKWSADFISVRVMLGQSALDFRYSPVRTIGLFLAGNFLFYLSAGSLGMYVSLRKEKEPVSLFLSLAYGMAAGLSRNFLMKGGSAADYLVFSLLFLAVTAVIFLASFKIAEKKDFRTEKRN